jgi:hypothetical protein
MWPATAASPEAGHRPEAYEVAPAPYQIGNSQHGKGTRPVYPLPELTLLRKRMHQSRTLVAMPAVALALLAAMAMAFAVVTPVAADATLTAELTGAAEVCDPANTCNDPEGTGSATVDITTDTGEICVTLMWDISDGTASAAHIHEAPEGEAGPVVLPLFTEPDDDGMFEDCFTDVALAADLEANPADYYVNVHSATYPNGAVRGQLAGGGEPATTTVMVMKHNCANVMTEAEFEAVEARAATNPTTPDAAFGTTVETVLECPTVTLDGDAQTPDTVAGGPSVFDFTVEGDAGDALTLSTDGAFAQSAACETDVSYDANRNGTLDASVCLDLSHYAFDVAAGVVTVTETTAPGGFAFGTVRFTPGSGDEATLVSAAGGVIELDTSADEDGMVMLHVYNFSTAAAPAETPAPTPVPTPMASTLPNTSTESGGPVSTSLVAIVALAALAVTSSVTYVLAARRSR